ncbi:MAG: YdeI/OmpD-associated family protein [Lewinellaceae bacterium]|nr:YdeI/OmpD-associated family protein [Lewinellaceae bacterium]
MQLMEITTVYYAPDRGDWRAWLEKNHQSAPEIWLQTYHKASPKPSMPYNDAVEEALCFGWIDGLAKKYDHESSVQRFTPRRPKSFLSELNRQRIFKLQKLWKMTAAGLAPIQHLLGSPDDPLLIPDEILQQLQADVEVWTNFQAFPMVYQKIRIGFVLESYRTNPEAADKRLAYLIKMTRKNKMYGTMVDIPPNL